MPVTSKPDPYAEYLRDKRVILVGPASYMHGAGRGPEIDDYDVVVRLNLDCPVRPEVFRRLYPGKYAPHPEDIGTRTDILYHTTFNERLEQISDQSHTPEQAEAWRDDGVQFVVTRFGERHARVKRLLAVAGDMVQIVNVPPPFYQKLSRAVRTPPNMGTVAIEHLLSYDVRSLHVTGMDFKWPWNGYRPGYGGFTPEQAARGNGGGGWGQDDRTRNGIPHNPITQMAYMRRLVREDGRLTFDPVAVENLGINVERMVTAILPMKGHNERLPDKNIKRIKGKPLFFWIVKALQEAERVQRVIVFTDSDKIAALMKRQYPRVTVIRQPEHVSEMTMNDALAYYLASIEGEHFIQVHATSPLLTADTIDEAVDTYYDADCDSVFTVTQHQSWFYDADMRPINFTPGRLERSQDLPPVYESNSALFVFSRESFETTGQRVGQRPHAMTISRIEAIDIDTPDDFLIAAAVMERRR